MRAGTTRSVAGGAACRPARDRGYATAELAAALPALVLVVTVAVWALSAAALQLRCADAARLAARAAARGDDDASIRTAVGRSIAGSTLEVQRADGLVRVTVRSVTRPLPWWHVGFDVVGHAVAAEEAP